MEWFVIGWECVTLYLQLILRSVSVVLVNNERPNAIVPDVPKLLPVSLLWTVKTVVPVFIQVYCYLYSQCMLSFWSPLFSFSTSLNAIVPLSSIWLSVDLIWKKIMMMVFFFFDVYSTGWVSRVLCFSSMTRSEVWLPCLQWCLLFVIVYQRVNELVFFFTIVFFCVHLGDWAWWVLCLFSMLRLIFLYETH